MVQKQISIYAELETQSPYNSDQLVLEISNTHIALMVKFSGKKYVGAFELFEFDSSLMDWYTIFSQIRTESVILDRSYNDTRVFYNLNEAVIMPANAFSTNSAEAYLVSVHGDNTNHSVKYDNIQVPEGMVNVYRIKKALNDTVNSNLMMITPRHLYSKLLESILNNAAASVGVVLKIQFFYNLMVVVLVKEGKLQLIQSYNYKNEDDVLYYLLNIVQQFNLSLTDTQVELSGVIDVKSHHFDYIEKMFKQISFATLGNENILLNYIGDYPQHYFTPFLNLAL
jgi:hypothetical protein